MSSLTSKTRAVVWLSFTVLLVQQAMAMWLGQAPWIIWLAILLPLVIFLPGLLQDNLRSFIWLCFVSLLYFMRLVVSLFQDPRDVLAIMGMVAVCTLFCSAMMYVRWRAKELRRAAETASGHGE
ncbi:MAG: DUF2069 domain-containing protein [Halioglobus sp.]